MKLCTVILSLALVILFQINASSQIPNSGFENWVDDYTPQDWITNSSSDLVTVQRSSTPAMGTYAAQLNVANAPFFLAYPTMLSNYFPVDQAYGSLMGYYQFQPVNNTEFLYLTIWMVDDGTLAGVGAIEIGTPASSYTPFSFDIVYFGEGIVPDSAYIQIGILDSGSTPTAGATGLIDELSFGPPTEVKAISSIVPEDFGLSQNYPNPFNPSTKINFTIKEQSYVELLIYDILGNEIDKLVSNNFPAGEYSVDFDAENLPSGIYLARLNAGKYTNTIKMTLLR